MAEIAKIRNELGGFNTLLNFLISSRVGGRVRRLQLRESALLASDGNAALFEYAQRNLFLYVQINSIK